MFNYDCHGNAYQSWRQHNSQQQRNTEFSTLALLRDAYPNHHVTETDPEKCDLIGYASAGHATLVRQDSPFDHFIRSYDAPENRLEPDRGAVTDQIRFGCSRYHWRGTDFLVYEGQYTAKWGTKKLLYVLHHADNPKMRTNDAVDALLRECGKWSRNLHDEIYVFDNTQWTKSKELWKSVEGSSWDDVILETGMKDRLIRDVEHFFDTRELYRRSNVPWKRGVILHGVPGNGKTVSIRALINSLAGREEPIPALYVKSLDSCAGHKWSIQQIFGKARSMAPCLLVFEDLDSIVGPKTRSYFLNEVDGLSSNEGILMIGSTNYLERLDKAITKRPSRFDRTYHFKLPDENARLAYALYWRGKFDTDEEVVDFPEGVCSIVAKITEGFSFAYLKELFIASLLALAARGDDEDPVADFVEEISVGKSSVTPSEVGSEPVVVGKGEDVGETAETAAAKKKKKKQQRTISWEEIHVPEDLKGNALLHVIIAQANLLLREMDSSDGGAESDLKSSCEEASDPMEPFMNSVRMVSAQFSPL
ncbi:P-loop containing nucleoside triphosphate hydrolase protein [Apodospora peruviana]|uniref:P-loop containing nucleoside triphosphate hydrolase protein n=1 Tax=Apodospora peruviana TaxID=516989 RepID=A0AAE0HWT4_9PEZI|nr:P-loop containing nucleoside triphosphate hydrolase protein [Apodospora peruviana]